MKSYEILPLFFYRWNRFHFWLLIFLNVFFGFLFHYLPENIILIGFGIILGGMSISYHYTTSLISTNENADKGFSLKYLRTLPLSHGELLFNYSLLNLFTSIPFIVFWLAFIPTRDSVEDSLKYFFFFIPIILFHGTTDLYWKFRYPTNGYFEQKKKQEEYLRWVKILIILICVILILFYLLITFRNRLMMALFGAITFGILWLWYSWFWVPILLVSYLKYFQLILGELGKKDYADRVFWVGKRDIPICTLCMGVICYVIVSFKFSTTNYYGNNSLLIAIHEKNHLQISNFIKKGVDLNSVNNYGFTPLMAAAYKGDWYSYKLLKNAGANKWARVNSPEDSIHETNLLHLAILGKNEHIIKDVLDMGLDPNAQWVKNKVFPIHMASQRCLAKSVDLLLQKGAKLEVLNEASQSALHLAADYNCPATAMLLLDHGLDPDLRDKSQKEAADYFKKSSEMIYYFDKKSRKPAGKR